MQNYYKPGSWNSVCPVCGLRYKAEDFRLRWDGQWICRKDWEPRHPQDFVRTPREELSVPFTYPDGDGIDVSPNYTIPFEPVPPGTFDNGL